MDDPDTSGAARAVADGAFETLLWELFLRFVELPVDAVESGIREAQRQCCDMLGLDQSVLWQIDPANARSLLVTHVYDRGVPATGLDGRTGATGEGAERKFPLAAPAPFAASLPSIEQFPWVTRRLLDGLTTVVSDLDALPAEAATDVASLLRNAAKSTVIVPLSSDAGLLGCVTFATTREPRTWEPPLVKRLELVGHVFGRALARKRHSTLIRESEEVNRATFDQSAVDYQILSFDAGVKVQRHLPPDRDLQPMAGQVQGGWRAAGGEHPRHRLHVQGAFFPVPKKLEL